MDKEKKIEEMATVLPKVIVWDGGYGWDDEQEVDCWETARNLINAGYGNIEKAIREFAEELKKNFLKHFPTLFTDEIYQFTDSQLDDLIKEKFGKE